MSAGTRRRQLRRPPDLTSLFDVLFIVVFAALIRAAAVEQAAAAAAAPAPRPSVPALPPSVAALRQHALASVAAELAGRAPLVLRVSRAGTLDALEVDGRRLPLDVPLLELSPDPDVVVAYLGDRSAELRLCRIAALHLGTAELARYLVIVTPAAALDDLPQALFEGLHRDLDRCLRDQHGFATLVDPSALRPDAPPAGAAP